MYNGEVRIRMFDSAPQPNNLLFRKLSNKVS